MPDATVLPSASELVFFYWQNKPVLTVGLIQDSDDDTIYWSTPPLNREGNIIDGGFLIAVTNKMKKTERIWVPVGSVSADGLSATGVIRGIDPNGLDYTTGNDDFILELDGGSTVVCVIAAQSGELLRAAIQGLIATGGSGLILGTDADGTVTIYHSSGVGTYLGFLRWNTATDKTEYSNDGAAWNSIDSVTASNLLVVTNADTTPGNLQNKTASGTGITRTVLNPGANEQLEFSVNGTLADLISDVTASATEINQALDGISANVTFTNLNTLTAGSTSNADALHTHSSPAISGTAGEAINGSTNAVPVGMSLGGVDSIMISGNTTGGFGDPQGGFNVRSFGSTDATWKYAQAFTYTNAYATITLNKITVCMRKVGAPVDNLSLTIQTDDGTGKPNGTVITNGTSGTVAGGTLTATATRFTWVTFTFSTPPTLTSGQKYHVVLNRSGVFDIGNYYQVVDYAADVYSSHATSSYTLSTTTWAAASNNDLAMYLEFILVGDGKYYKLDADNLNILSYKGWTKSNVSAGGTLSIIYSGTVDTLTGLTAGKKVYASTTAGSYSHTPPSSDGQACIALGIATSTTSILIEKEGISIGVTSGTLSNATTATSTIHTADVESGTLTVFIKTGFRPKLVEANGTVVDSGANYSRHSVKINQTSALHKRQTLLNTSLQYVTASTTDSITSSNVFLISGIVENGFYLTVTGANFGSTTGTSLQGYLASV